MKSRAVHAVEIRQIIQDIQRLLTRIEDAVPLINLAITTSGARLSTTLPASVSPSRLLQASTFLTAGDTQYSMNPNISVQIGPIFTLSVYMLFASHVYRTHENLDDVRDTTWKEAIHKARVKLVRKPLHPAWNGSQNPNNPATSEAGHSTTPVVQSIEEEEPLMSGEGKANEFAYHLEVIEDLDDNRVHSFEEEELQPGPYEDVDRAGIRESLPVYQVSKIFYADTGKILNIGNQGESNNPVLLLKRDINALPPRRMMQDNESNYEWEERPAADGVPLEERDHQDDINQQIRRESSVRLPSEVIAEPAPGSSAGWRFPPNLDPEWLALEVYAEEEEEESGSEDEQGVNSDAADISHRHNSPREDGDDNSLAAGLADLNINPQSSPPTGSSSHQFERSPKVSPFGPIRSSLSLLEMLIRLTALQQFQQASHLSIPDELLTFFLEESSTTGAGGDGDARRRTRREARQKVGFDPYDESPVKRRGEEYQYQNQDAYRESPRRDTPDYEDGQVGYDVDGRRWSRERSMTPQRISDSWLLRSREGPSSPTPNMPLSSPASPYRPLPRKAARPVDRVRQGSGVHPTSPLGRGASADTDSSLGTSPRSPTPRNNKGTTEGI